MRLLMIAWGYLPYAFSEGLCNGKLVYALKEQGVETTVISRVDNGNTYSQSWTEPWNRLKDSTILIDYPLGNRLTRMLDVAYSSYVMDGFNETGVRWARRAYQRAFKELSSKKYDAILTRSPNDIAHLIGYKLKKKTGIKWIANWNDPASPIWPNEYKIAYSHKEQERKEKFVAKLLKAADLNTFPSDSLRQHFHHHFPFLESLNTEIVPHIALPYSLWPMRDKSCGKSGKMLMLHSGNLSAERNPTNTFKAMRELIDEGFCDFEFHIMGQLNDYTNSLITHYGLNDYVRCIGSFGYLDAVSRMQDYDVLVLLEANLDKGIFFASKFTDYAQAGKPILAISPKSGFAKDMITECGGGVFADNTQVGEIKAGIKTLIEKWRCGNLVALSPKALYANFEAGGVARRFIKRIYELE